MVRDMPGIAGSFSKLCLSISLNVSRGQCGTHDDTELHEEIINGEPIMVRHVHRRELYWIHR